MNIHRRGDQHRRPSRHQHGCQQVVGDAGRDLANDIRRGGGYDQKIGLIGQVNMAYLGFLRQAENLGCYGAAGEGLKRQRCHKLHSFPGHDDLDCKTIPGKQTNQLDRLITGNPA